MSAITSFSKFITRKKENPRKIITQYNNISDNNSIYDDKGKYTIHFRKQLISKIQKWIDDSKLDKNNLLYIFKIFMDEQNLYSQNRGGYFINSSDYSDETITKLKTFVDKFESIIKEIEEHELLELSELTLHKKLSSADENKNIIKNDENSVKFEEPLYGVGENGLPLLMTDIISDPIELAPPSKYQDFYNDFTKYSKKISARSIHPSYYGITSFILSGKGGIVDTKEYGNDGNDAYDDEEDDEEDEDDESQDDDDDESQDDDLGIDESQDDVGFDDDLEDQDSSANSQSEVIVTTKKRRKKK